MNPRTVPLLDRDLAALRAEIHATARRLRDVTRTLRHAPRRPVVELRLLRGGLWRAQG